MANALKYARRLTRGDGGPFRRPPSSQGEAALIFEAEQRGWESMNGNRYYGVRVAGAKYGVGFGSALAIAISYTTNHSILWAIIHGILGWLYVIYFALFRS